MKTSKIVIALAVTVLITGGAVAGLLIWRNSSRRPIRPTVCDRTGRTLLTDRRKNAFSAPVRHAKCGGRFASALLGHTIDRGGRRVGACGVEYLIDRSNDIPDRVLLTLDGGMQQRCEAFMDRLLDRAAPEHAHITVVDSDGALIAAAQRPAIDLNDRRMVEPRAMVFMASTYVFPIPDEWMRLLGSASDAAPEHKLKLRFHRKLGIFPGEGKGSAGRSGAQSATALNILLACAGSLERKDIPEFKVFAPGGAPLPALKIADDFKWRSLRWSKDGSTFSALGSVSTEAGTTLYMLLRVVFGERCGVGAEDGCRAGLEKAVREFSGEASPQVKPNKKSRSKI